MTVVVLGAGIAGLVAGCELTRLGYNVRIVEADGRVGGRIFTHHFQCECSDSYGELGAMRIPSSHKSTLRYIEEVNLQDRLIPFRGLFTEPDGIVDFSGHVSRFRNAREAARRVGAIHDHRLAYLSDIRVVVHAVCPPHLRHYYDTNVEPLVARILESLRPGDIDEPIGSLSVFRRLAPFLRQVDNEFKVVVDDILLELSEEIYTLRGGLSLLPESLALRLGSRITRNVRVTGINCTDEVAEIAMRDEGGRASVLKADRIICTIPFSILRHIFITGLSERQIQRVQALPYSPASKTLLHCRTRFWERRGIRGGGSVNDRWSRQIFYPDSKSIKSSCTCGVLLASYAIGGDALQLGNLEEQERNSVITAELARFHPEILSPDAVLSWKTMDWNEHRFSRGAYASAWVDKHIPFESLHDLTPERLLTFAGEHCSTLGGWIEGAIKSALTSVEDVAGARL
ncbi:flavin monoamine oxidase family protein [Streptomyces sp. NPDC002952]|uniref:flavin monoamine oxidase family protein n=1 Tax=Streptomyces sp. NPDC002952 TaxID=3364673 RepID=UPI0036BE0E29